MKSDTWKSKPGSFDVLNLFFRPALTPGGFPVLRYQGVELPQRLIQYKNWKQYQPGDCLHYFIDDYRFEHLWKEPKRYLSRLQGKTTLTPDFSLYVDYPEPMQRWNVYRSRWLGAYWQANGVQVIPTVSWSDERSYDYCFAGIEQGSTVAISTNGCRGASKAFTAGVEAMIEYLLPETILCYGSFRKAYCGHRLMTNVVNYPYWFGSFRGQAAVHATIDSY